MVGTRFTSSAEKCAFLSDCMFPEMAADSEPALQCVSTGQRTVVWAFGKRYTPSGSQEDIWDKTWVDRFIGYYPRGPSSPQGNGLTKSCIMPYCVALATINMLPCGFNKFTCTNRDKQTLGHLKAYSRTIINTLNYYEEESACKEIMQVLHLWPRHRMLTTPG